ncbi:MAG TPA: hypothetical protein VF640_09220 [Acidimicrobiales bacterium]|jgi:hypothetical protein
MLAALTTTFAGISFDPTIRGILVVGVGLLILCGSVYLLLATNLGSRLGMLVALAGLFGWMTLMGIVWWIYGIGMVGPSPTWDVVEVNYDDLSVAQLDEARALDEWDEIPESAPTRGEAQAAADAFVGPEGRAIFQSTAEYVTVDAFETGGETYFFTLRHKPHYALVRLQGVIEQPEPEVGEAPPPPEADPDKPVVSVIMERNLGHRRLPPALVTVIFGTLFGITCNVLHRRDKLVAENRARAAAAGATVPARR